MKKKLLILTTFAMVIAFGSNLSAQTVSNGDTLEIGPLNSEGNALGALNEAIHGDTTATGERVHKVYKLQRGAQYILTEVINADFPLVIVADEPDDNNRPPIIRTGLNEAGETVALWWRLFDHATFKNLWISGINLEGNGGINWISQEVNNEENTIKYEGCILEFPYTNWAMFADWGKLNSYYITDCIFMNIGNPTGATWNGAIWHGGIRDSLVVKNSTFYNFGAFAAHGGDGTYYLEVDQNTFVNSVVHAVGNHNAVKQKFTNNLFVNAHSFSDDRAEIMRHFDQEVKGIINYAEIQWNPNVLDSLWGPGNAFGYDYDPNSDGMLTDDELVFELKNNGWYYTKPITDYWDKYAPDVVYNPWMNNYNQAMFDNQDGEWEWQVYTYEWPVDEEGNNIYEDGPIDSTLVTLNHEPFQFFVEENTMNVDPGLVNINGTDALLAQNCDNIRREWAGETVPEEDVVKFHGIDNYLAFTWPLNFDLSYTNETLQTGSTQGGPVGSLQWFPDFVPSNVSDPFALDGFELQNFPNPFSSVTNIRYTLTKESMITIDVYNTLGVKVSTLVNELQQPGEFTVMLDGTEFAEGIYFVTLKSGNQRVSTKKMMLLK